MKILIASGIYPPDIGGPAQYARNLYETWKQEGHDVKVAAYRWERAFPPVVKHLLYFIKIIRKGWNAELILVLDNFLAAVPTMLACMCMRKKYIIRTGGDLLWEWYVERTGEMVLFKDFYKTAHVFSMKEKIISSLSRMAFKRASAIIFSTEWQKGIWEKEYALDPRKTFLVENYCGERQEFIEPEHRSFVAGSRLLKLKNTDILKSAFESARAKTKERGLENIELDLGKAIYDSFFEKIHHSYAVILPSISDINPNIITDAISCGIPFIMTRETGMNEHIKELGILFDPLDKDDLEQKILWLADPQNRKQQAQKIQAFRWVHSWADIAGEIVDIWKKSQ